MGLSGISMMRAPVWVCALLAAAVSADSGIKIYKKVGDEVVLKPDAVPVTYTLTNIMWKDAPNIAMEWDGKEIDSNRHFNERGSLNISTGEMTITGLIREDSGEYIPEINGKVLRSTHLFVISPVPKPTITKVCDDENTHCTLTCNGNITGADSVTYLWRSGDTELADSEELRITKEDSPSVTKINCELRNPVSQEKSDSITHLFITPTESPELVGNLKISTGLTVFISLLAAVLVLVLFHRWKAGAWFYQKESMPWEADFWREHERTSRAASESNGAAARQEKRQADEETPMT